MLDKADFDRAEQLARGIALLKEGKLVAFPTDTVYGLGACFNNSQAIELIYDVKARPRQMALPLLVKDKEQIALVASYVSPVAMVLIDSFMPGGLTIILPKSEAVLPLITAGGNTIAVRIPAHPIPLALMTGLGTPIIGTSANLSGHPSPLTAEEVYTQLNGKVDLIIDGGHCPGGKESTIVDVTRDIPVLVREGMIPLEKLQQVAGSIFMRRERK